MHQDRSLVVGHRDLADAAEVDFLRGVIWLVAALLLTRIRTLAVMAPHNFLHSVFVLHFSIAEFVIIIALFLL